MRLRYWLPPVLWMTLIITLSSDIASADHTRRWAVPLLHWLASWATPTQIDAMHGVVRKGGHLTEYAVLASLWYRAFVRGRGAAPRAAAAVAFAISAVWAVLDETRQSLVPSRTASAHDVALDSVGALLAMLVATFGWRAVVDRATITLLWIALVGGIAFLVVNALTDVPSGILWLTSPLAALLLLTRAIYTRRPRP